MKLTEYEIALPGIRADMTLAVLSDFHNGKNTLEEIRQSLGGRKPDAVLIPGDICNDHLSDEENGRARDFLKYCAETAPAYYSLGNHEWQFDEDDKKLARSLGVRLLDNTWEILKIRGGEDSGIIIGGLTSVCKCGLKERTDALLGKTRTPDPEFSRRFDGLSGARILLCHHPEYYPRYLKNTGIDLIVAGHAHGGQIRLGKRTDGVGTTAVFAPGQGLFPRLTSGIHDGRLLISRGLTNSTRVPRFGNPTETVLVHIVKK